MTAIKLGLKNKEMVQVAKNLDDIEKPDVIICPLMKTRIPPELYNSVPTLIAHPGPPGDRGASSLDWCVYLRETKWGVTVLQAVEEFDAGNVWGFDLFDVADTDTKSSIYCSQVQKSAIHSIILALERIKANKKQDQPYPPTRATNYTFGMFLENWRRKMRFM